MLIRLSLNGVDFKDLVSGKVVCKDTRGGVIEISLRDIGFSNMRDALEEAVEASGSPLRRMGISTGDDD